MHGIRRNVNSLRTDVKDLRSDVQHLQGNVYNLRGDVHRLEAVTVACLAEIQAQRKIANTDKKPEVYEPPSYEYAIREKGTHVEVCTFPLAFIATG